MTNSVHYLLTPLLERVLNDADAAFRKEENPMRTIREAFRDSEEAKKLVAVLNDV